MDDDDQDERPGFFVGFAYAIAAIAALSLVAMIAYYLTRAPHAGPTGDVVVTIATAGLGVMALLAARR